ncbi:gamma interferon inducible lysosomal thiol reductase [Colletotrichum tofieldiae]|nr:gamma interferon inducible lysosomal thiol reductase [Colletotrichum tofieldiae]
MGAHRGCSEHRTAYRQQREAATSVPPSHSSNTILAERSKPSPRYRYPEPDTSFVMDEKRAYLGYRAASLPPPSMTTFRRQRKGMVPTVVMVAVLFAWSCWGYLRLPSFPARTGIAPEDAPVTVAKDLVPLEAHIMSKCPDARDCLRDLVLPTMMKAQDKVNFTLSYIGTPTENDGVDCKHGPSECMGNIIELCAAHLYPDPKINLGFTMCLTREYSAIPDRTLVEDCALEHAIDIKALNDCATEDDGGFGVGMLRDSVRRSKNAGVTKSCTVRLNEEFYCIRDDGQWKDCPHGSGVNDLVIAIEKLLAKCITQCKSIHARLVVALHDPERLHDAVEPDGLAHGLRRAGLELHVHNVNVEVVVGWLVVHVELELVEVNVRVLLDRRSQELGLHVLQPRDVLLAQVAQGPQIAALDQPKKVQRVERLAVPVQVWQQQEALVAFLAELGAVDDVLDFGAALDDVEDPVEAALVALALHVGPDVRGVELGVSVTSRTPCLLYFLTWASVQG